MTEREREIYRQGWKDCRLALAAAFREIRVGSVILTDAEDALLAAAAKVPTSLP